MKERAGYGKPIGTKELQSTPKSPIKSNFTQKNFKK
jgi:hypothetical protein